jgi:hypothetical protein
MKPPKKPHVTRPDRPYWMRAALDYAGQTVHPSALVQAYGVDRSYGCRILQKLVDKKLAKLGEFRGEYYVYVKAAKV